jgi:NAD(P)-dependent dehydrogenase (short-subunit alcohol dehydrogenase family)
LRHASHAGVHDGEPGGGIACDRHSLAASGEEVVMSQHESAYPLGGQVAITTGASSGLGRASALALAGAGADVALLARTASDLEQVAAQVRSSGRRALPIAIDLARESEILAAVERVVAELGRVDILVNAAGTDVPGAIVELAVEDWDRVLAVNLRAPFLLARAALPHMQRARHGTIVNVSSVAGKRGWANAAAYCASKFGLTGLTQALAAEARQDGVRACIVYPGGMATSWGAWSAAEREAVARAVAPTEALPPEDVAAFIVWLASAPSEVVVNEAVVTPLHERGWP